jgi:hypothetical protein
VNLRLIASTIVDVQVKLHSGASSAGPEPTTRHVTRRPATTSSATRCTVMHTNLDARLVDRRAPRLPSENGDVNRRYPRVVWDRVVS